MAREAYAPEWQQLTVSDAQFLGRLAVAGLALPNAPHLSQPALEVVDIAAQVVQAEIDRLVAAAETIASITGGNILGLAHSQLAPTPNTPEPLQILLAPARLNEVPVETTIKGLGLQCLINTKLTLPATPTPRQLIKAKEGVLFCRNGERGEAPTANHSKLTGAESLWRTHYNRQIRGPALHRSAARSQPWCRRSCRRPALQKCA